MPPKMALETAKGLIAQALVFGNSVGLAAAYIQ